MPLVIARPKTVYRPQSPGKPSVPPSVPQKSPENQGCVPPEFSFHPERYPERYRPQSHRKQAFHPERYPERWHHSVPRSALSLPIGKGERNDAERIEEKRAIPTSNLAALRTDDPARLQAIECAHKSNPGRPLRPRVAQAIDCIGYVGGGLIYPVDGGL